MGEITKPVIDFTDKEAFGDFMQSRPLESVAKSEGPMSVSDFKSDPGLQEDFEIF